MATPPGKQLAVVTGASAGIGRALALRISAGGRPVLAVARRADRLVDLQQEAEAKGGAKIHMLPLDVAAPHAADKMAARAHELGGASLLVNNAGFGVYGRFERLDPRRLSDMVRTNCEALVLFTQALLPDLAAHRGTVLNVASAGGFTPMPFMAAYGASKAFVISFTEALAAERIPGVRFAAFCPGPVETEFGLVAGTGGRFHRVPGILSADAAAEAALALLAGDGVVAVPGPFNKLAVFGNRVLPRALMRWAAARLLRPREEAK
ncbi:MAG TPA: SDR family NAD(P)-dependent oxidoreductase [Anaeromyxobacteraceae bacterium]|nr:SDR family NAD(P)-dependent oxidoreductase [Anaeromyxobacteraceae bacterium]